VPLVITTDYRTNNTIRSASQSQIYDQILEDLKDAQNLLLDDYSFSQNERVRANKGAATALLARVHLFNEDWANAEIEASKLIDNQSLYGLEEDLNNVFRTQSKEAILQFWYTRYPMEFSTFLIHPAFGGPVFGGLTSTLVSAFEPNDLRLSSWIQFVTINDQTYYRPMKYQTFDNPPLDYSTLLRLAEQYLIRAEARAQQNKLGLAADDLNIIRNRSGLPNTPSFTYEDLMSDIMKERQTELFTEWGHRWFDLVRTGQATAILEPIKPGWNVEATRLPIPEVQIINNPNTLQVSN
jgi:hypothetical protein